MAGVQAQRRIARIGAVEETLDLGLCLDVAVGVLVEVDLDAVFLIDDLAQLVGRADERLPCVGVELRRLHIGAGVVVAIAGHRHKHQMASTQSVGQLRHAAGLVQRGRPARGVVQAAHPVDRTARHFESALRQLVAEALWIGRQVAVRPELDPLVTGRHHLVEKALPRRLGRIVGEPHTP